MKAFLRFINRTFFHRSASSPTDNNIEVQPEEMKYLIVGLGNIGAEYAGTRHNIGFMVLDTWAREAEFKFETKRYGDVAEIRLKNQRLVLLKPSTYMNLSGDAVRYWMQKEKIDLSHVLVVVDDIALPFGVIRLRGKGADGGHNGLKDIGAKVGSQAFARLRFGIGNDFPQGMQIDYVLGHPTEEEATQIPERAKVAIEAIKAYCLSGLEFAMTHFNNK